jgi:hypothetical protein
MSSSLCLRFLESQRKNIKEEDHDRTTISAVHHLGNIVLGKTNICCCFHQRIIRVLGWLNQFSFEMLESLPWEFVFQQKNPLRNSLALHHLKMPLLEQELHGTVVSTVLSPCYCVQPWYTYPTDIFEVPWRSRFFLENLLPWTFPLIEYLKKRHFKAKSESLDIFALLNFSSFWRVSRDIWTPWPPQTEGLREWFKPGRAHKEFEQTVNGNFERRPRCVIWPRRQHSPPKECWADDGIPVSTGAAGLYNPDLQDEEARNPANQLPCHKCESNWCTINYSCLDVAQ